MLNNLFSRKFIFLTATATASVFTLTTVNKATAQIISDIAVDPYNDSSYQTQPIDIGNGLNKAQQKEITNKIYINAPATPQPPQQIDGNLTSSNQFLPEIPPLGEPYSEQQKANTLTTNNNNSSTLSVSVSPFDITPTDDNNSLVNQPQSNQRRTISVSPSNTNQNTNLNQNQTQTQTQPQQTNNQVVNVPKPERNNNKTKVSRFNRNRRLSLKQVLNNSRGNGVDTNTNTITSNNTRTNTNYSQTADNNRNSSIVSSLGNQKVYKVLVKVNSEADKEQIRSLYPEAFNKRINGESFLQIGLFSSQENVDKVSRELDLIGFKAIVN